MCQLVEGGPIRLSAHWSDIAIGVGAGLGLPCLF